jgi:hypothetical protein
MVPTLGGEPKKILSKIDSPITRSPDGKQIAYVRDNDGFNAVDAANDRMAASGTNVLAVTDMNGSFIALVSPPGLLTEGGAISADGRHVAFDLFKGGDVNIWIVDSYGANLRQLTHGNVDEKAGFRPTVCWVLYQHWSEGKIRYISSRFRLTEASRFKSPICRWVTQASPIAVIAFWFSITTTSLQNGRWVSFPPSTASS